MKTMARPRRDFLMVRGLLGQPIKIGAFTGDDDKTPTGQTYEFDESTYFSLRCAYQMGQHEQLETLWQCVKKLPA